MDPLKSGNVSGSVDVNCPKSTLWREYSQKGVAQPMELKVYKPHERCYLCIRIIKANGLRGVNPSGLSDPYVTVDWGNMSQQTATIMDNCNPEYDETLYFPIKARMSDMPQQDEFDKFPFARINVWDFDEAGDSDFRVHGFTSMILPDQDRTNHIRRWMFKTTQSGKRLYQKREWENLEDGVEHRYASIPY